MISYITGKIIDIDLNSVVLLTNSGIGYEIIINEIVYSNIYSLEKTELFIYHYKTENSELLFGFTKKEDKAIFKELIKISGIGGKVAMQILSLGSSQLIEAISIGDNKTIESIKGIGKKMAEKIILELKEKEFVLEMPENNDNGEVGKLDKNLSDSIKITLVNMGYNAKDVEKNLKNVPKEYQNAEEIISYLIQKLV